MAHCATPSFTEVLKTVAVHLLEVHELEIARASSNPVGEKHGLLQVDTSLESQLRLPPNPPQQQGSKVSGSPVQDDAIVTDIDCNSEDEVVDFSLYKSSYQEVGSIGGIAMEKSNGFPVDESNDAWAQKRSNMPGQINGHIEDGTMVREVSPWSDTDNEARPPRLELQGHLPNGSGKKAAGTANHNELAQDQVAYPSMITSDNFWQRSQPDVSHKLSGKSDAGSAKRTHWHKTEAVVLAVRSIWHDVNPEAVETCSQRLSFQVNTDPSKTAASALTFSARTEKASKVCCRCGVMHPVGPLRMFWNAICLLFILYDLFMVPLQAFDIGDPPALQGFEWFLTVWWTLDVLMTFRTGYYIAAALEMRPRRIAVHYARSWLLVDLMIVTLEWTNRFAVTVFSGSFLRTSRVFRTLRLTKLVRVTKLQTLWSTLLDRIHSNLVELCCTMILLTGILLLTIHWVGCLWYMIGDSRNDGWITYDLYAGEKSTVFWYVASLRWVISQLNGRTDLDERRNMLERLITCTVGVLLSVIAHAVFISFITKTILDLGALVSEKTHRRQLVNEYLAENPLPQWLKSQLKRCLHDYKELHQELHEEKVLEILPKHLQTDLLHEVRAPVITQHQLFLAFSLESPWVMRFLCRRVVQIVSATRYEVIFDTGDVCNRMLFTDKLDALYGEPYESAYDFSATDNLAGMLLSPRKGKNESQVAPAHMLRNSTGGAPKPVSSGSWVSEPALWSEWRNRGRLVADGHGFLLGVQAFELAQALQKHPDAYVLASLYASCFVAELRKQALYLSDVLPFDVQLISPILLRVTVVGATSSHKACDLEISTSKLYCACKVIGLTGSNEARFKTVAKAGTLSPSWNHVAEVGLSRNQPLEFSLLDMGRSPDRLLGVARLVPDEFLPGGFQGEVPFDDTDGSSWGSLNVTVEVVDVEETQRKSTTIMSIKQGAAPAWMRNSLSRRNSITRWHQ